jgi:hypothetical protein
MDKNEQGQDVLDVTDVCAIQGDRMDAVSGKYHNVLFYLGLDPEGKIFVRKEYCLEVPKAVVAEVEEWLNNVADKRPLPTYFYDHILLNGVERIPHLHMVYIAESEDAVWEFVND